MTDFYPMGTATPQQEPLTINQGYNLCQAQLLAIV